uniref:Uncharacterized protein n=1 Tax=Panagrolaimus davidi TaxID=227884 RepID=A0A914QT76_9BILA
MDLSDSNSISFESIVTIEDDNDERSNQAVKSTPFTKCPKRIRTNKEKAVMAANARLNYHKLPIEKKKEKSQKRAEAYRRKKEMMEKLLATPINECTPEMVKTLKEYMLQQQRRSENGKKRYAKMSPDERKVYNSKRRKNYKKKVVEEDDES